MRLRYLRSGAAHRAALFVLAAFSIQCAQQMLCAQLIEPPQATAEISESILMRVRRDAYAAWQSAEEATSSIAVTYREHEDYTYVDEPGQTRSRALDSIVTIWWDPGRSRRLIEVNNLGKGIGRNVLNSDYRFLVFHAESATGWALGGGRRGDGAKEFKDPDGFPVVREWLIQSSFRLAGIPLRQLVEGAGFKLTEAKSVGEPGSANQESIVLRSTYTGPKTEWILPPAEYWVVLRPDNGWLIDRGGAVLSSGQIKLSTTLSYQPGLNGLPFQHVVTHDKVSENGNVKLHRTYQFEAPGPCAMPDTEFRLEYYGIPESAIDSRGGWSPVVLGALGLVALVVIYLVVRRVSQRRPSDV